MKGDQKLSGPENHSAQQAGNLNFTRQDFGDDFYWGVANAAAQTEGAALLDGRGPSIWDRFSKQKGRIKNNDLPDVACDFYHRYESDLQIAAELGFRHFRFSISWSRIFPEGKGNLNPLGVSFYNNLINKCIALGLEPWVTLYHWDLPDALELLGGWKNREVIGWFSAFAETCARHFGDRVKKWVVLNEPMAVAGLGYTTGLHAPGKKGIWNFLPVVHHLAMCQAEGGRILRKLVPEAYIGTAFSCSYVHPHSGSGKDLRAARRADALMNRLFLEPALGLGYPADAFGFLKNIKRFMKDGDAEKLVFDFDFIGVQNYFSVEVKHSYLNPLLWLKEVPASLRNVPVTAMGWEINPEGMRQILHQFDRYEGKRDIIVSENGAAFEDSLKSGEVSDQDRVQFFQAYLGAVLQAKREGVPVRGYLAWTLMDNFEWAEGYAARFGLVYVDFETQRRIVKDSGKWFKRFLG